MLAFLPLANVGYVLCRFLNHCHQVPRSVPEEWLQIQTNNRSLTCTHTLKLKGNNQHVTEVHSQMKSRNSGIQGYHCMPLADTPEFLNFSVVICFAEIRWLTWILKNINSFTSKITNLAYSILCGSKKKKKASKTQLNCSIHKRKINIKIT